MAVDNTPSSTAKSDHHHAPPPDAWGTAEELLLASAVNRYGTKNWELIASEIKIRTASNQIYFTPVHCQQKYKELKRRFNDDNDDVTDDVITIPWLDDLKKQRIVWLQNHLQNLDPRISSLQLTVKKLKEEKEKPAEKAEPVAVVFSGTGEDESDRSVNGSNGNVETNEPEKSTVRTGEEKPVGSEPVKSEPGRSEEDEEEGGKNSDVQSSVRRDRVGRGSTVVAMKGVVDEDQSTDSIPVRSLPLVDFLHKVNKVGSTVFDRRLDRQEKARYKNLIRQHIDYEILQTRLKEGWYSDGNDKFFRDLLLLVSNTRIFFQKESPESAAAVELRQLILKEMMSKRKPKTDLKSSEKQTSLKSLNLPPKRASEPADSLLLKPKLAGPIVVCRKRSSITAKAAGSSSGADRRKEPTDLKNSDKLLEETPKRSRDSFPMITKKKGKNIEKTKFLNRMKRSNESLLDSLKSTSDRGGNSENSSKGGGEQKRGGGTWQQRLVIVKEVELASKKSFDWPPTGQSTDSPAKRSVGRPPKRGAAPSPTSAVLGKRNREPADTETMVTKQTKKRSKR
ncbi:DNA-binding bromodomain-containing protein [Tanacetum coccineum]